MTLPVFHPSTLFTPAGPIESLMAALRLGQRGDVRAALCVMDDNTRPWSTGQTVWRRWRCGLMTAFRHHLLEIAGSDNPPPPMSWSLKSLPGVTGFEQFQAWILKNGQPVRIEYRLVAQDGSDAIFRIGDQGLELVGGKDAKPEFATTLGQESPL